MHLKIPLKLRLALRAERSQVEHLIASLAWQFDDLVSFAFTATDDEHDPDGSNIAFERAKVAALLAQSRGHLRDIDQAIGRIEAGTFGICCRCGLPIGRDRLSARPRSRSCICARSDQ